MNEIGFRIMRSTGNGGALTQIGTALANHTNFVDTTVTVGTPYRYQVVVYNAAGSRPSNTVSVRATAPPPQPPAPSTNVAVTAVNRNRDNDRITLTWTRPAANNQTGYTIQLSTSSAFPTETTTTANVGANVTTWTSGNVSRGTPYYLQIQATNTGGASAVVQAAPFPITTP